MARSAFEELDVYRLAEQLAHEVWKAGKAWNAMARATLGIQAIKAADSIGANIAEGFGRGTAKENRHFVRIARGSLCEITHWMRTAYRRELLTEDQVTRIKALLDELGPKLNAYLRSINRSEHPAGGIYRQAGANAPEIMTNDPRSTINDRGPTRRDCQ